MKWKTVSAIQQDFEQGDYSSRELTQNYLERIVAKDHDIGSFLEVLTDAALAQADESDKRLAQGNPRELEGVPMAIKDNMALRGVRTTAGSKILEHYTAVFTATAVQRLQDKGAVIIGKTNLDEFAMGSSTEFSAFHPTKNPHDTSRVPGGSSGGSAAAVASDFCAAALGSDTGGSIRQPASFCGVVGFKPTYGRVSRHGLLAMSSSLDQIGPFTRSVEDAARLYAAIAGKDQHDATTVNRPVEKIASFRSGDCKGVTIGVPKSFMEVRFDEQVRSVFEKNLEALKNAGATIREVDIPFAKLSLPVYYLIVTSEVSSNLARYDGIGYGSRQDAETLIEQYIRTRTAGFGPEAKRRILLGTFTLSAGYRDKYYKQAVAVRSAIKQQFRAALEAVDVLVSPTSPTTAFKMGEKFDDPLTMYLSDLFTVSANIANIPAISIPGGDVNGMPAGFQLMGKPFGEAQLLAIAARAEAVFGPGKHPANL